VSPSVREPSDQPAAALSCPGKVFLLGEYGILAGLPAWVLALAPRFRIVPGTGGKLPHPESPAGRLIQYVRQGNAGREAQGRLELCLGQNRIEEAHAGVGGFGGSTAEFALWAAQFGVFEPKAQEAARVWKLYRKLTSNEPVPPSGADLVAQWSGGVTRLQIFKDPGGSASESIRVDRVSLGAAAQGLLVFSAAGIPGRKVATHQHLAELREAGLFGADSPLVRALRPWLAQAEKSFESAVLGPVFDGVAEALAGLGLEHSATREDRQALRRLPGVLGVKGAGALQADALLVLCKSDPALQNQVVIAAEARGLKRVDPGLGIEPGLLQE
jgi:hypothetical protein